MLDEEGPCSSVGLAIRCHCSSETPQNLSAEDYCKAVDEQSKEVLRLLLGCLRSRGCPVEDVLGTERQINCCSHDTLECGKPLLLAASSREQYKEILRTYADRDTADKKLLGRLLTVERWAADEAQ